MSEIHIDRSPMGKCYAVMWSYGMICVGSGCCKRGAYKERIAYHKSQMKEEIEKLNNPKWSGWGDIGSDLRKLQEKNIRANIKLDQRMIKKWKKKLAERIKRKMTPREGSEE